MKNLIVNWIFWQYHFNCRLNFDMSELWTRTTSFMSHEDAAKVVMAMISGFGCQVSGNWAQS